MTTVNFDRTPQDGRLIDRIVERAKELVKARKLPDIDALSLTMDITACHANGNPLRLQDLLNADDFNFSHDVFGIRRHIDRDTGKLLDHFSPRFSRRD